MVGKIKKWTQWTVDHFYQSNTSHQVNEVDNYQTHRDDPGLTPERRWETNDKPNKKHHQFKAVTGRGNHEQWLFQEIYHALRAVINLRSAIMQTLHP